MIRFANFSFLFFLLFSTALLAQQNSTATLTADKNKILIGEQITLRLQASFKDVSTARFFNIDSFPHFEVLNKSAIDTQRNNANVLLTQRLTITSWDSGRWQIPSLTLPGSRQKTKPVIVDVVYSSFNPEQDYHDIKDIISVKKESPIRWYWYLIGALLAALLFMLLFPNRKKPAAAEVATIDAYKTAIKNLQSLKTGAAEKDVKAYYTELVFIFRKYLHQKKNIYSYSKTTEDLKLPLKKLKLDTATYNNLLQVLQLSDAVKFAKLQPTVEENNKALAAISKSIDSIEKA